MEPGFVQCRDGVYWSSRRRLVAALPPVGKGVVRLDREDGAAEVWKCPKCKMLLAKYR